VRTVEACPASFDEREAVVSDARVPIVAAK
jgi:hypothetical protein